jgi:hypothetical protein
VQELPSPLVPIGDLCHALSHERLGAYSRPDDWDSTDAVARYLWNGALSIAFHPSLHALEVALRNNLFRGSESIVSTTGRTVGTFRCWLDMKPSFLYPKEQKQVDEAIDRVGPNPRFHTPGRLIAKLGFGFWCALCRAPYDHSRPGGPQLWPRLLKPAFPFLLPHMRKRQTVQTRLDDIREFRNRIAHHEPVWDHDLLRRYDEILGALSWMYPNMAKAVRVSGNLEPTLKQGFRAYRPLAARLLGSPPECSV